MRGVIMNEQRVFTSARDRAALAGLKPAEMSDAEAGCGVGMVKKPWGSESRAFASEDEEVWFLHLDGNAETSMHCHPNKETLLIVADGCVTFSTLDESFSLPPGSRVWIQRGAFHRTKAHHEGASVIEIESPPDKKDLVRLSDKYGREARRDVAVQAQ